MTTGKTPDPIAESLRVKIAALAAGDFGIEQLTQIEGIARAGKQLLQAAQGHDPDKLSA